MINKILIPFIFSISMFSSYSQTECIGNFEKRFDFNINKYRVYKINDTLAYTGTIKIPILNQGLTYFTSYKNGLKDGLEYSVDSLENIIQHRDIFHKNNLVKSTHYFYEENKIVDSTYVKKTGYSVVNELFLESLEEALKSNNPRSLDYMFWDFEKEHESTSQLKQFISMFDNIENIKFKDIDIIYNSYNDTNYNDLKVDISFKDYLLNVTFKYLYLKSEGKFKSQLFGINQIKKKSHKNYFKTYIQEYIKENLSNNSLQKYFLKDNQMCELANVSKIFSYQGKFMVIYRLQSECYDKDKIISLKLPLNSIIEKDLNVKYKISVSDYKFKIDGCQYENEE